MARWWMGAGWRLMGGGRRAVRSWWRVLGGGWRTGRTGLTSRPSHLRSRDIIPLPISYPYRMPYTVTHTPHPATHLPHGPHPTPRTHHPYTHLPHGHRVCFHDIIVLKEGDDRLNVDVEQLVCHLAGEW